VCTKAQKLTDSQLKKSIVFRQVSVFFEQHYQDSFGGLKNRLTTLVDCKVLYILTLLEPVLREPYWVWVMVGQRAQKHGGGGHDRRD